MATSIAQKDFPLRPGFLSFSLTSFRNLVGAMRRNDGISFRRNLRCQPRRYFKG